MYPLYLHEVSNAFLAEDIFEEDQVFFVVGIRVKLRREQSQDLMQPLSIKKKEKEIMLYIYDRVKEQFLSRNASYIITTFINKETVWILSLAHRCL